MSFDMFTVSYVLLSLGQSVQELLFCSVYVLESC